jgi:hypothetical protein
MMQALIAGGLAPIYSLEREKIMNHSKKNSNPNGWFELMAEQFSSPQWLHQNLGGEDTCVKIPTMYLRNLPVKQAAVIWMHRDPQEIIASFGKFHSYDDLEKRFGVWPESYYLTTKAMREVLEDRKCVQQIIDIEYSDLVSSPRRTLSAIPRIDSFLAAKAIDPSLYRNRRAA